MLMRSVDAILSAKLQRGLRLRCKRPRVAELILTVDGWLRRHLGVFEYSERHDCFLRAQVALLRSRVVLSDGTVGDLGERVIHLHFWNEHVPPIPSQGPSLAWARRFNRCFIQSLRDLARFLADNPQFADIAIIRANMSIGSKAQSDRLRRITARHGFEVIADGLERSYSEYARWFGEDILYWLLTIACNPSAARLSKFWRNRTSIYLSRKILESNHPPRPEMGYPAALGFKLQSSQAATPAGPARSHTCTHATPCTNR